MPINNLPPAEFVKVKVVRQTVNNSVVLVDDNDLYLPLGAGDFWLVRLKLLTYDSGGADAGVKIGFTVPVGCVGQSLGLYTDTTGNGNPLRMSMTGSFGIYAVNTSTENALDILIPLQNGVNAGNFQLQFAQNTAQVRDTGLEIGSSLIARRLI